PRKTALTPCANARARAGPNGRGRLIVPDKRERIAGFSVAPPPGEGPCDQRGASKPLRIYVAAR
ncbi:MAG: hypothetical protein ACJAVR_004123, partial [Paracoccaceae bacterium]